MATRVEQPLRQPQITRESSVGVPGVYYASIPVRPLTSRMDASSLEKLSLYNTIAAAIFILAGLVAISFPFFFVLALEQLLGWILIAGGVNAILTFFMLLGAPSTWGFLLLGLLHMGVGTWLIFSPTAGVLALAIVIAGWFIVHGIIKVLLSIMIQSLVTWYFPLVSGILSVGLGVTILFLYPGEAVWILGVLVGSDLILTGLSLLSLAIMAHFAHSIAQETEPLIASRVVGSTERTR